MKITLLLACFSETNPNWPHRVCAVLPVGEAVTENWCRRTCLLSPSDNKPAKPKTGYRQFSSIICIWKPISSRITQGNTVNILSE